MLNPNAPVFIPSAASAAFAASAVHLLPPLPNPFPPPPESTFLSLPFPHDQTLFTHTLFYYPSPYFPLLPSNPTFLLRSKLVSLPIDHYHPRSSEPDAVAFVGDAISDTAPDQSNSPPPSPLQEIKDGVRLVCSSRWVAKGPRGRRGSRHHPLRNSSHAAQAFWVPKAGSPEKNFRFREEDDELTTVMIKNIPNKFSKKQLLELLDSHCFRENQKIQELVASPAEKTLSSEFDFLYLPMDFTSGNNLGYAFVNFSTAEAARRLHRELHSKPWNSFGSRKVCEITYAKIQGLARLLRHFRSSIFTCSSADYLPVFFKPSRDGVRRPSGQLIGTLVDRQYA